MTSQQEMELLRAVEVMAHQTMIIAEKLLHLQRSLNDAKIEIIQLQMQVGEKH